MPETALTVQEINGSFATIAANGADFAFAAGDAANNNEFVCTGRELVIAHNSGVSSRTVDITSVSDEKNRSGSIASYTLGAGEYAVFGVGLTNSKGWKQIDGTIILVPSHAEVEFAILRLPAGYP